MLGVVIAGVILVLVKLDVLSANSTPQPQLIEIEDPNACDGCGGYGDVTVRGYDGLYTCPDCGGTGKKPQV